MIDRRLEGEGSSVGEASTVNVVPPLYLGGVPSQVYVSALKVQPFKVIVEPYKP